MVGSLVLTSMQTSPGRSAANSVPYTARTSSGMGRLVNSTSTSVAAASTDPAAVAPSAPMRATASAAVSNTVTG